MGALTTLLLAARVYSQSIDPSLALNPNGFVSSVAVQDDGKIVFGGNFTAVNGTPRSYLARANADGTLDNAFAPTNGPSQYVSRIVARAGKLFVAAGDGVRCLNLGGGVEWHFPMSVLAFDVDAQSRVLLGGQFTRINNEPHRNVARLTAAGALDSSFTTAVGTSPGDGVYTVLTLGNATLVGGAFQSVNGASAFNLARVTDAGALDNSFSASADAPVIALVDAGDGKVLHATAQSITRLFGNGTPDGGFTPISAGVTDERFTAVVGGPGGKLLAAGNFTVGNSATRLAVARFNADGSHDSSFNIVPDNAVQAMAVQDDGSVILAGHFTTVNGQPRAGLVRVLAVDATQGLPTLAVAPGAAGTIVLSWAQSDGMALESQPLSGGNWAPVAATPAVLGGRAYVTNTATSAGELFRLRKTQ